MLVISLKVGESIRINDDTIITLIEKWTGEVALRVETDQVIIIDDTKPQFQNLYGHA
ncbi:carbon storage regulator [Zhongshania guokunii]|uniref:Carbon storage regulator n=1 Tax=Zhongshania guokunii TaxID=641783 RepID=A0ABV3U5L3_9GAMM